MACVAIAAAALDLGTGWGPPIWILLVLSPAVELLRSQVTTHGAAEDLGPAGATRILGVRRWTVVSGPAERW